MLDDLRYRLRALFRRRALDRELDAELQFHIEQHAAIDERAGVPATRRCAAHGSRSAASSAKEESRDGRGVRLLEVAGRDLRYAVRTLARTPMFTVVAIVSLTLGIGANTAMFQLLDALVLPTLPVARPRSSSRSACPSAISSSPAAASRAGRRSRIRCWSAARAPTGVLTMFAWADDWFNLSPSGEVPAPGLWVSGDYLLRARPHAGARTALHGRRRSPGVRRVRRGRQPRFLAARAGRRRAGDGQHPRGEACAST